MLVIRGVTGYLSPLFPHPSSYFAMTTRPPNAEQEPVEQHRSYLLRYAMLQLRDPALAEDAVQETLLAAIESRDNFAGQSSLKTWLVSILKHKIIDLLRKRSREPAFTELSSGGNSDEGGEFDDLFDQRSHWQSDHKPSSWGNPDRTLENKQFMEMFEFCAARMSAPVARVFMLREVMGLSTDEICKDLCISTSNCWVMLHRARMSLRLCLETNWFGMDTGRK